jgi:hypothetical protein
MKINWLLLFTVTIHFYTESFHFHKYKAQNYWLLKYVEHIDTTGFHELKVNETLVDTTYIFGSSVIRQGFADLVLLSLFYVILKCD